MKTACLLMAIATVGFFMVSCASEGYNTQKGAAIGAIGGALAGQAIGHNTAGTLIGAAGGALVGAVIGNGIDQDQTHQKMNAMQAPPSPRRVHAAPAPVQETLPGEWVVVPGQWQGGTWVPSHKVWVPVNPR
jgi:hypothetical protein